ncbi:MAG TPA: hypothetical protein VF551_09045, partial [Chthoniobacterales bacterium]
MTTWTDSAKRELERYLQEHRGDFTAADATTEARIQRIRVQVLEEASRRRSPEVTDQIVRDVLARITAENARRSAAGAAALNAPFGSFIFGVILPLITIAIEVTTKFCAGIFFDPIPSIPHLITVAAVPAINFWVWRALRRDDVAGRSSRLLFMCGVAAGVSVVYTALYLPLLPFSVIAVLAYGIGLLPMTPVATLFVSSRLWRRVAAQSGRSTPGWMGAAAGLLAVCLISVPSAVTAFALHKIGSGSEDDMRRAVSWLRTFGSESALVRQCYANNEGWFGMLAIYRRRQ